MDGLFVMGQNPAVAGPNSGLERRALGEVEVDGCARDGGDGDGVVLV